MTVVLHSGIRKNGATRISVPPAPRSSADTGLSADSLSGGANDGVLCPAFNRPWMSPASVQRVCVLRAVCAGHTEAHHLACRFLLGIEQQLIDVRGN